jgi:carboxyl-terminal processing protease
MKHRLSGVILDLRGSSGGLFREAIELADLFRRSGCLVTTRPPIRHASARDQLYDVEAPLVILVDHKTASAAELVAATLRARNRAVLIGDGTSGEALLQTVYSLSSGALLKLTNGEMLAGDATPIHGRGVEPDVALPVSFEPDNGTDRAIDFAKQVLRGTRGGARSDLLATAHKLAAATR